MENCDIKNVVDAATMGDNQDIDHENVSEDEFHDADDNHDLTRPSDWTPKDNDNRTDTKAQHSSQENEHESDEESTKKDSTGCDPTSPDYVDDDKLDEMEAMLTLEEKEQKRLEANQYKQEGNALHKEGKHLEACDKYTAGLRVCPLFFKQDRSILYANRGAMKKQLCLPQQAIANCSKAIELNPQYLKALLRRAQLYEETDKLDDALKDFQSILELDARHLEANNAVRRLPAMIEERNEKLKTEMFDNLKKLGNMVLNPFGLSTENFKMQQDPNTGGYNIQFQQNQ